MRPQVKDYYSARDGVTVRLVREPGQIFELDDESAAWVCQGPGPLRMLMLRVA
jgi:hypothetical protein